MNEDYPLLEALDIIEQLTADNDRLREDNTRMADLILHKEKQLDVCLHKIDIIKEAMQ